MKSIEFSSAESSTVLNGATAEASQTKCSGTSISSSATKSHTEIVATSAVIKTTNT